MPKYERSFFFFHAYNRKAQYSTFFIVLYWAVTKDPFWCSAHCADTNLHPTIHSTPHPYQHTGMPPMTSPTPSPQCHHSSRCTRARELQTIGHMLRQAYHPSQPRMVGRHGHPSHATSTLPGNSPIFSPNQP